MASIPSLLAHPCWIRKRPRRLDVCKSLCLDTPAAYVGVSIVPKASFPAQLHCVNDKLQQSFTLQGLARSAVGMSMESSGSNHAACMKSHASPSRQAAMADQLMLLPLPAGTSMFHAADCTPADCEQGAQETQALTVEHGAAWCILYNFWWLHNVTVIDQTLMWRADINVSCAHAFGSC